MFTSDDIMAHGICGQEPLFPLHYAVYENSWSFRVIIGYGVSRIYS